jgi:hypothetical protein
MLQRGAYATTEGQLSLGNLLHVRCMGAKRALCWPGSSIKDGCHLPAHGNGLIMQKQKKSP